MKLSVNEAKLTGLLARNCATIQQFFISKFSFGPKNLRCLVFGAFMKRAPGPSLET